MARKRQLPTGDGIDLVSSHLSEEILGPERFKFSLSWEM